jgi:hypothetical protein
MKVDRIQQLASRLERWRKKHRPPTPIPLDIWVEAAELARAEGPGPISRRLGLDYGCLKKRMGAPMAIPKSQTATFVQLLTGGQNGLGECALEVAASAGLTVRIAFKDPESGALINLVKGLVEQP